MGGSEIDGSSGLGLGGNGMGTRDLSSGVVGVMGMSIGGMNIGGMSRGGMDMRSSGIDGRTGFSGELEIVFAQNRCNWHRVRLQRLAQEVCAPELRDRFGGGVDREVERSCIDVRCRCMDFYMELALKTYFLAPEVVKDGSFGQIDEIMDGQVTFQMYRDEVWQQEGLPFALIVNGPGAPLRRESSQCAWVVAQARATPTSVGLTVDDGASHL